jgi:predicted Zn-dependent peptidase
VKGRWLAAILLAALVGSANGARALAAGPDDEPGGLAASKHPLPNGLRVVIKPNPRGDIVALDLLVGASAAAEPEQLAGLRQLTQQLLLRGTQLHSGDELADYLEGLGASLDVAVGLDYVEVFALAPASAFAPVCRCLAEVVSRPLFDPGQLESQREAALQFASSLEDDPFQSAYLLMRQTLYGDHPYGRAPAGTPPSLARISRQDLLDFYHAYYRPNNAVLGISGNVSLPSALAAAAEAFGEWQPAPVPAVAAQAPRSLLISRLSVQEKPIRVSYLVVGFLAPGVGEEDYFPLQVAEAVLGGGMSSRLFTELRGRRGLVYEATCFYPTLAARGHFSASAVCQSEDFREVSEALVGEFRRLRENPLSGEELARAKQYLLGSYALAHQRNRQQAYYLAWYELLGVGYQFDQLYPRRIAAVTAEQVRRAAQNCFTRYAQALLLPQTSLLQPGEELGGEAGEGSRSGPGP